MSHADTPSADKKALIRLAAERHSDLLERLSIEGMRAMPQDPDERREARVQFALLQAEVNEAAKAVHNAINKE